jgi:hypothetical protein
MKDMPKNSQHTSTQINLSAADEAVKKAKNSHFCRCIVQALTDESATELAEELLRTEGLQLDENWEVFTERRDYVT